MICCEALYQIFKKYELTFFSGVPDSTFKDWMGFLDDMHGKGVINRIASIERDAIAWAAGYYVATKKTGVVYMQNSGLGNVINPLTSFVNSDVYKIPMLLMIGWRGHPGLNDEPQHVKMGGITESLLQMLDISYSILSDSSINIESVIEAANDYIKTTNQPYALLVRPGSFVHYERQKEEVSVYEMKREEAIKTIVNSLDTDSFIVSTTGKTSRELFEYREAKDLDHHNDFLMIGSMGLACSFAAEIALQSPHKKIYVFDGDGALLMNLGALSSIGHYAPPNLYHIVFDNAAYESTGGQPTTSSNVNFEQLAIAQGYRASDVVTTCEGLQEKVRSLKKKKGPYMLIVKIRQGSRPDLGRPTITPIANRMAFMKKLISDL